MHAKGHKTITWRERQHMGRVRELDCSLCDRPGPSQAHHIEQQKHYIVIALCPECHANWHGTKELWRIRKMDELDALNITIGRLYGAA